MLEYPNEHLKPTTAESHSGNRFLGVYDEGNKGPLLLVFAGMHGNEPAGVQALRELFEMLEKEPQRNPGFRFRGRIVGLLGNKAAHRQGVRYQDKDLNRQFTPENVKRVHSVPTEELAAEDLELREFVDTVRREVEAYDPELVVVLDLHTTTASGGIFSIVGDDDLSQKVAVGLHAPVIRKLINGIRGTTLHYFNTENMGRETVSITFESGQHHEPLSVKRAIAAVVNCMRSIGSVAPDDVEHKHDHILIAYSKGLPKIADLLYCHSIAPGDEFVMRPGYQNFQKVEKGELLAHDRRGEIRCESDGRILMPLYQKQGEDGFFIIKTIEAFEG